MTVLARSALGVGLALALAGAASAHAKLVAADPAVGAAAAPTNMAHLTFNETISGKLSGATVTDAAGKTVPATAMAQDKMMMLTFKSALAPGAYKVKWHAVASDDGHRTEGVYSFTVK